VPEPLIQVRGLKKAFRGNPVLRGVDLDVEAPSRTSLARR
jgi:ABC-type sugar transport system ATPase subunit